MAGALLALLWLCYVISSTANTIVSKALPSYQRWLGPAAHFLFGNTTAYYLAFSNRWLVSFLLDGVRHFWHHGVFGVQWAGKGLFLASMLVSVTTTRLLGLFRPKSLSAALLLWSVRLLGASLLFYGSSNGELSCALVVVGLLQEHLVYFQYRLQIEILARSATTNSVARVSTKTFEETKRITTARELKKLQAYLASNPGKTDKYYDTLYAGGRREQARDLYRFAQGDLLVAAGSGGDQRMPSAAAPGGGGGRWSWGGGSSSSSSSRPSTGSGAARNYSEGGADEDDDEDDDAEWEYVVMGSPAASTKLKERLARKSPASQRRLVNKRTPLWFRLLFPFTLLLLLVVVLGLGLLRLQHSAYKSQLQSFSEDLGRFGREAGRLWQ